jgi:hypothetical protein
VAGHAREVPAAAAVTGRAADAHARERELVAGSTDGGPVDRALEDQNVDAL